MKLQEFKKLSKEEQRVRIAKDVLQQLKKKFIVPISGVYIDVAGIDLADSDEKSFQEIISKQATSCEACAIGAMFVSSVKNYNSCNLKGAGDNDSWCDQEMRQHLSKYFTMRQMRLIELFFEGSSLVSTISEKYYAMADHFYYTVDVDNSDEIRMQLIMKNIIDNKGSFLPSDEWIEKIKRNLKKKKNHETI